MKFQSILSNYGLYNFAFGFLTLGCIGLDAYFAFRNRLLIVVNDDDLIPIIAYFFCLAGYFFGSAIVGEQVYDRPAGTQAFGVLDGFVISTLHFLASIAYLFYWIRMPADDWNPGYYYNPDFFWVSYLFCPLMLGCQFVLTGICVQVLRTRRNRIVYSKLGV
uniref:Uncharacterized protein n=1 Tax=Caenorhabditis tropicalis TaxID=1561998 RepID=A0A1I7TUU3_9PELO